MEGGRSGAVALLGLAMAVLLPSIGGSMILTTMPVFMRLFGASYGAVQWLSSSFFAMLCLFALAAGHLGDAFGRSRMLLAGIILFGLSSAACAMAPGLGWLLFFRIGQGVGGAVVLALVVALAADLPEGRPHMIAVGVLNGAQAFGTMAGPPLAGLGLATAGWRSLFVAMTILSIAAGLMIWRGFAGMPDTRGPVKGGGRITASTMFVLFVTAALLSVARDGRIAAIALICATVVAAMLARRSDGLARFDRTTIAALIAVGGLLMVMSTTLVVGSFLLTRSLGLGPVGVGLCLAMAPMIVVLVAVPTELIVRRMGERRSSLAMMLLFSAGIAIMAFSPAITLPTYLLGMVVIAIGYSGFQTAATLTVIGRAPESIRGFSSSCISLSRNMGMIAGTGILGQIFAWIVSTRGFADLRFADPASVAWAFQILFRINSALVVGFVLLLWLATSPQPRRIFDMGK